MAFCPNCGKQLADGAKFCVGCGNPVAPAAPVQPVAQPAPVNPVPAQPVAQPAPVNPVPAQPVAQPAPVNPVPVQPVAQPAPVNPVPVRPVAQPAPVNPVPVQPVAQPTPVNPMPAQPVYVQSAPVQGTPVPVAVKKSKINWTVLIILLLVGVLIIGAGVAVVVDIVGDGEFNLFGLLDSGSDSDDDDDDDKKGDKDKEDPDDQKDPEETGANDETSAPQTTAPAETEPEETEPEETEPPTTAAVDIVGTWKADIDLSGALNDALESSMGEGYLQYLYVDEFEVGMTMEFTESGNFSMRFDANDFNKAMEKLIPAWTDGFADMIVDMGMTVEAFEIQIGMSLEEYMEMAFASGFDASSFESMGQYELNGDELRMGNADGSFIIEVNGNRMEFVDYTGNDDDGMFELFFKDVTFKRK